MGQLGPAQQPVPTEPCRSRAKRDASEARACGGETSRGTGSGIIGAFTELMARVSPGVPWPRFPCTKLLGGAIPAQPCLSVAGTAGGSSVEWGSSCIQAKEASLRGSNPRMMAETQFLGTSSSGVPG